MKRTFTTQLLAAIPAVAAMKNSFVQLNKKLVLLLLMLATGLVAHATIQSGIQMQGLTRTVNNVTMCTFAIQSEWGGDQIPSQTGSSYTFSNARMIHGTADVILNGTLNFQEGTAFADVIASGSFTVTIESSSLWFYGATVQTKSGTNVSGCSASVSSDKHTLTVTIPSGKTFGIIIVDYVSNPPMTNSNTTVTVPAGDYWVSNSSHRPKPEPTVVYGQTTLVKDTDYTLSWSNNSSAGTGTVTVTGKGNYAGSATGTFSIRWARYYVHFDKNHNDATGTMSDQQFTYNTAQALTANTFSRTGYSFDGWCTTSNGAVTYTDGQSVSNLTAEDGQTITLYAKWTLITYNITYNLDGGSVATANPTSYNVTTNTFTLNNPTKTGYTFAGWTGSNGTTPQTTVTIAQGSIGNRSYTANWTPITYNITYNLDGGSVATANPATYTIETPTFTLNNPTKAGYTFTGWTGSNGTTPQTTVTITQGSTGNLNYTAHWSLNTYNITYDLDGGSVATANPATYTIETPTFTLNNPTKTGYTFAGWTGTDLTQPTQTVTITQGSMGDRSYTAHWTPTTYNITYDLDGGSATNPTTYTIETPTFTLNNPTKTGYTFDGWTGTGFTQPTQTVTITQGSIGNRSYTANWTDQWNIAGGADGSEAHPYLITTTAGLDLLATEVNSGNDFNGKFFKLGNNITYTHTTDWDDATSTENNYTAIGTTVNTGGNSWLYKYFKGTFDGCGYMVSGIRIYKGGSTTGADCQGLFGELDYATIKNVTLSDARITGRLDVGGIVGYGSGSIENCHVSDNVAIHAVVNNANSHGGIIGQVSNGTVSGCTSAATLTVADGITDCTYYGGIAGYLNGYLQNCLVVGASVSGNYVGAVTGYKNDNNTYTANYYHNVTVNGTAGTTNVGIGGEQGNNTPHDIDGVRSVHTLTLGEDITASGTVAITYDDTDYYTAGTEITLAYSGTIPEGYNPAYSVNGTAIVGNTFEMPAADVVVEAVLLERYYIYNSTTGELALIFGAFDNNNKWGSEVTPSAVTSVTATNQVNFTGNCYNLFYNFTTCMSMDLSNVNTDALNSMFCMFWGCSSLQSLDLSSWNTANVTDMGNMFYDCSSLQSLNLSGWNTANVTSMNYMFYGCSSLQSLDLSGWNTANVIYMRAMFYGCSSLQSLDLSSWNTANVTGMPSMFQRCSGLQSLNLSGWNTANITDMGNMFYGCSGLQSLNLSGWNTANVTNMASMFSECPSLQSLNLSGWNTDNVTQMTYMFKGCSSFETLDLSGWNTGNVTNMRAMFYNCSSLTTIDLSGWNTANVINMEAMFNGCSNLTTIYVGEGWTTEYLNNSANMFSGCTNLVGGMGTTYDANHTGSDYARIDMGSNSDQPGYLTGVFVLTLADDITASPAATLTHDSVNYYAAGTAITLSYGGEVPEGYGPVYSVNGTAIEGNTFTMPFEDASVTVEMKRLRYTFINGELALLYGEFNSDNKWGSDVSASAVTSVTATDEVSFTGDCSELFYYFSNCTSMDLSNVNTESVTNMADMFNHCTSLTTLDLTGWNTTNVTDMNHIFFYCSVLETLEGISDWDVSNVTNMNNMFAASVGLATLDLSDWNTTNVTNMAFMFYACTNLATLDIANWDTEGVTDMSYMFTGCHNIETLDLSSWNTSNVTNMTFMFIDCPLLTTIYVGEGWSTENVTSSTWMFYDCTSLVGGMGTEYDEDYINAEYARIDHGWEDPGYLTGVFALTLADDITASPVATLTHDSVNYYAAGATVTLTYSGEMPEGYVPVYSVNGNPFSGNSFEMPFEDATVTVDVQLARYTFNSVTGELALIWGEFNKDFNWGNDVPTDEVTSVTATNEVSFTGDCTQLFLDFTICESIDLSNVNTDEMTIAEEMFAFCESLETLDLSGWNTSNVIDMGVMFVGCESLTSIEGLADFNTTHVESMYGMFAGCIGFETLDLTGWNTANVTDMSDMFYYCTSLETLDISDWNTSNVEDMSEMFIGCESLTSIEGLSNINTTNVESMEEMFRECISLDTLDLSGWNTNNVEDMALMFYECTNLTTLNLSGWNTSNVIDMTGLFAACQSLTSIEGLSDFNTTNVEHMNGMFAYCESLETLDLSGWNTANVNDMTIMFEGSSNLTTIYVGEGWSTDSVNDNAGNDMFLDCINLVGGMGTEYDENHVNAEYAHIDGGTDNPGYFSEVPLDPVEYIDADGNTQTCTDYIVLEGGDYAVYGGYGVEAWYVVDHDVTYNDGVTFYGDVNLILVDGATLNLVNESEDDPSMYCYNTLTVYVQSGGTGAIVSNNVKLLSTEAIIHGGHFTLSSNSYLNAYNMTINGGQISAETNEGALYASQLTINGGTVAATVTGYYDAICADYVVINGGVITTTNQHGGNGIYGSYDVTINGGIVTANSSYNYGIYTNGTITLGWTNESDRITASSYYGEVTVATGQAFSDETGHCYLNTLTDSQIAAIAGQTLSPFNDFGATFTITYMTNGGTLPDNYPATYTFAETVTLPIPTKEDNTFVGWYDNATFEGDSITEIVAGTALGNKTFYACWKPEYIDVTYLDADGQTQTAHAKVLYGIETELPGGVYTIVDDVYLDKLSFTGNTTIILPDYKYLFVEGMGKGTNDDEYSLFVNGNLTIYGQEYGTGLLGSYNVQISGDVAIYGGSYDIGYLSANNGSGTITLSWTALGSSIRVDVYLGDVVLAKDFMANDFEGGSTIIPAGQVSDNNSINAKYLTPYAETIDVSYIDENGATHTVNAHVLYGGETNLDGGYYTVIGDVIVDHTLSFEGNTTLIIPDDSYWYSIGVNNEWGDDEPIEGNGIAVEGDLAIYGQTRREGNIVIEASEAAIYATGNVTVSNVYFDTYTSNYGILSGGNILIAGGRFGAQSTLIANDGSGTITLGYLTEDDIIVCDGYEGIVVVREGQTLEDYWYHQTFSGALTAEEIAYIGGKVLVPYIIPITLTVEGYGDGDGGWYLLASPLMGNTNVENVDGLISATPEHYDLYRFNEAAELEWENWKQEGFSLESGRGYLYANKEGTTLTFTGVPAPSSTYEVTLAKTEGAELAGWNLIGNPFNANATVDKDFYMMNPQTRDEIIAATNSSVAAMEGIFVIAAEDGETATFNAATSSKGRGQTHEPEQIVIELSTLNSQLSTSTIDRAIVRFGEGQQLPKFQLRESSTKVYIPQDGEDYAIVSVGKVDELPVNFKANKNGEYTLTVSETLSSQLSALSLLDNLTGARIDLLETPSYTFNALTTDYASRFKLVFATGDSDNSEDFAFISNGNIIINGEGTLQVIDALGRILLTQKNTTANCKLSTANYKPGVYVLRLINGEDVKTQKIVIK